MLAHKKPVEIISVGSVDGVLTTSALLALYPYANVAWTQAFDAHEVPLRSDSQYWLVDLGVNTQDHRTTELLIHLIHSSGSIVLGIVDEHGSREWKQILSQETWNSLLVKPETRGQNGIRSSGSVLRNSLDLICGGDNPNPPLIENLLRLSELADEGRFEGIAETVNMAIKADIRDNRRRDRLARWFSRNTHPSGEIEQWVGEYREIQALTAEAVEESEDCGIYCLTYADPRCDMTSLSFGLAKQYPQVLFSVVVLKGEPQRTIFMAAADRCPVDLLETCGVPASVFAKKVTVPTGDGETVLRNLLAAIEAAQ